MIASSAPGAQISRRTAACSSAESEYYGLCSRTAESLFVRADAFQTKATSQSTSVPTRVKHTESCAQVESHTPQPTYARVTGYVLAGVGMRMLEHKSTKSLESCYVNAVDDFNTRRPSDKSLSLVFFFSICHHAHSADRRDSPCFIAWFKIARNSFITCHSHTTRTTQFNGGCPELSQKLSGCFASWRTQQRSQKLRSRQDPENALKIASPLAVDARAGKSSSSSP